MGAGERGRPPNDPDFNWDLIGAIMPICECRGVKQTIEDETGINHGILSRLIKSYWEGTYKGSLTPTQQETLLPIVVREGRAHGLSVDENRLYELAKLQMPVKDGEGRVEQPSGDLHSPDERLGSSNPDESLGRVPPGQLSWSYHRFLDGLRYLRANDPLRARNAFEAAADEAEDKESEAIYRSYVAASDVELDYVQTGFRDCTATLRALRGKVQIPDLEQVPSEQYLDNMLKRHRDVMAAYAPLLVSYAGLRDISGEPRRAMIPLRTLDLLCALRMDDDSEITSYAAAHGWRKAIVQEDLALVGNSRPHSIHWIKMADRQQLEAELCSLGSVMGIPNYDRTVDYAQIHLHRGIALEGLGKDGAEAAFTEAGRGYGDRGGAAQLFLRMARDALVKWWQTQDPEDWQRCDDLLVKAASLAEDIPSMDLHARSLATHGQLYWLVHQQGIATAYLKAAVLGWPDGVFPDERDKAEALLFLAVDGIPQIEPRDVDSRQLRAAARVLKRMNISPESNVMRVNQRLWKRGQKQMLTRAT